MCFKLGLFLCSTLVFTQCEAGAVTCSRFIDITMGGVELLVNTSGIPCVRCLGPNGQLDSSTFYFIRGKSVSGRTDVVVIDGVMMILEAESVIPDGYTGLQLHCQVINGISYSNIKLLSNSLVPPITTIESLTINEGGSSGAIFCLSASPSALDAFEVWLNPQMMVAAEGTGNILNFMNITRNQAGVYTCVLTSRVTGLSESVELPVTVNW